MNLCKYVSICFFISLSLLSRDPLANLDSSDVQLLSTTEMRFCYISFVKIDGKNFLIKQKKTINKMLGAVRDAITAYIAESLDLAHKVDIIPAGKEFPGKVYKEWPATLHTIAPGKMIKKQDTPYKKMNIKQAEVGFRRDMIPWMAKHSTLAIIVALDTFLCNHDRHRGNLFYNENDDSFCAIDMDSSFKYSLGALACKNFIKMDKTNLFPLKKDELKALVTYKNTLNFLINKHKPEEMIQQYNDFITQAGIVPGSPLYTKKVHLELERNRAMIRKNYEDVKKLTRILNLIIKRAVKS